MYQVISDGETVGIFTFSLLLFFFIFFQFFYDYMYNLCDQKINYIRSYLKMHTNFFSTAILQLRHTHREKGTCRYFAVALLYFPK